MRRRDFLAAAAGATALASASCTTTGSKTSARRPNIIFAFSDEHRWQSMSCSEMPMLHTPQMQRMATEGVCFTHCVSNYPVCTPYRSMLMTGLWPYQTGMIDNNIQLSAALPTLGKTFHGAGYRTGYIGKWHLGGVRAEPFGFDESLIWTGVRGHHHAQYHPKEGGPVDIKGYGPQGMTNQALEFVENNHDRPFFLMLSWIPPHADFLDAPEDKLALYPEGSLPWRPNVPDAVRNADRKRNEKIWDKSTWPYYRGYHAHISAVDEQLGRLMAQLDDLGLTEDTILVYTSDHGSMFGSHGVGSKRQPYEESIRVPLFFRWPGHAKAGATRDALLGATDLLPTLCGLAGIKTPQACRGRDVSASITGDAQLAEEPQLIMHIDKSNASGGNQHPAPIFRGVRTSRYTYAVREDGPWLLFDNQEDPCQLCNRVNDPVLAPTQRDLHRWLADKLIQVRDPFKLPRLV